MSLSNRASRATELNTKLFAHEVQSSVRCALKDHDSFKNERVETYMSLRHLINKEAITTTKAQGSTYNKRTFPFEMNNDHHVQALETICEMFCNPWENSATKRVDLTDDIADFFLSIRHKDLIVLTADDYNALVTNQKKTKTKKKTEKKSI